MFKALAAQCIMAIAGQPVLSEVSLLHVCFAAAFHTCAHVVHFNWVTSQAACLHHCTMCCIKTVDFVARAAHLNT